MYLAKSRQSSSRQYMSKHLDLFRGLKWCLSTGAPPCHTSGCGSQRQWQIQPTAPTQPSACQSLVLLGLTHTRNSIKIPKYAVTCGLCNQHTPSQCKASIDAAHTRPSHHHHRCTGPQKPTGNINKKVGCSTGTNVCGKPEHRPPRGAHVARKQKHPQPRVA